MRRNYHTLGKDHTEELSEYLSRDGQLLLPLVELLETAEIAVDDLIDNAGRSTIEAVMKILAQDDVAEAKHQEKRRGKDGWHRSQTGVFSLSDSKLRVKRPLIRRKGKELDREVTILAYESIRTNESLGSHVLDILLAGMRHVTIKRYFLKCFRHVEDLQVERKP